MLGSTVPRLVRRVIVVPLCHLYTILHGTKATAILEVSEEQAMELVKTETQTMPEKLVWNVKEAGAALGVSPWTVRRYISTGKLTAVRLNRRVFVEPAECRRLVEQNRAQ